MPPTIAGPGPSIDPPFAATPFTVLNSTPVSDSQMILPSLLSYARNHPFIDPENTAPGITEIAAACALLHRGSEHGTSGDGVCQTCSPVAMRTANRPPGFAGGRTRKSDRGKYAFSLSAADPHSNPPSALPTPARNCHRISPSLSGSRPQAIPDF